MNILPRSLQKVIEEFSKLPGIGNKSASRLAFYLINQPKGVAEEFGQALLELKNNLKTCSNCFNITDQDPCVICSDSKRDKEKICVVEHPLDVLALEKTHEFNGLYHILGGAISPVDGIGPDDLRIEQLLKRVGEQEIEEVILATNPSLEGEATAMYITKEIRNEKLEIRNKKGIKVTRIARGLPMGGDLEYADEVTLSRALEGRKEY
jgi:recombination protein RecR